MQVTGMDAYWNRANGPGVAVIWDINQAPANTFASIALTKTRHGASGSGAGGYAAIIGVDGDDLINSAPAAIRRNQVRSIKAGVVSEGQYAECAVSVFRFV